MDNNPTNQEFLSYDFSLSIGDTLHPYNVNPIVLESITTVITSDDKSRRVFEFDRGYFSAEDNYTEGIGGNGGLFFPIAQGYEGGGFISCVKSDELLIFRNSGISTCDVTSNISDIKTDERITIYPNPVLDNLFIESGLDYEIQRLKIFDSLGNKHWSFENSNMRITNLDVSFLK